MSNSIDAALFLMRPRAANVRPLLRLCACCAVLLVCALAPRSASATISYTISLNHPEQHLFHVTMSIPVEGREVTTALPAWNALYQIRNFAERVRDVSANCQSLTEVPLAVRK